jgi:hypothetical protein
MNLRSHSLDKLRQIITTGAPLGKEPESRRLGLFLHVSARPTDAESGRGLRGTQRFTQKSPVQNSRGSCLLVELTREASSRACGAWLLVQYHKTQAWCHKQNSGSRRQSRTRRTPAAAASWAPGRCTLHARRAPHGQGLESKCHRDAGPRAAVSSPPPAGRRCHTPAAVHGVGRLLSSLGG